MSIKTFMELNEEVYGLRLENKELKEEVEKLREQIKELQRKMLTMDFQNGNCLQIIY